MEQSVETLQKLSNIISSMTEVLSRSDTNESVLEALRRAYSIAGTTILYMNEDKLSESNIRSVIKVLEMAARIPLKDANNYDIMPILKEIDFIENIFRLKGIMIDNTL